MHDVILSLQIVVTDQQSEGNDCAQEVDAIKTENSTRSRERANISHPVTSLGAHDIDVDLDYEINIGNPSELHSSHGQVHNNSRHAQIIDDQEYIIDKVTDHVCI